MQSTMSMCTLYISVKSQCSWIKCRVHCRFSHSYHSEQASSSVIIPETERLIFLAVKKFIISSKLRFFRTQMFKFWYLTRYIWWLLNFPVEAFYDGNLHHGWSFLDSNHLLLFLLSSWRLGCCCCCRLVQKQVTCSFFPKLKWGLIWGILRKIGDIRNWNVDYLCGIRILTVTHFLRHLQKVPSLPYLMKKIFFGS